jgi:hypothetical protein
VIGHYSSLARTALTGGIITDCDPGNFADGGFGAAAYSGTDDTPEGALRASLGCGNPLTVASLHPGETVLDLGSGGGLDVLLSARRVAPAAPPTAWTPATTCSGSPVSASPAHTRPASACTPRSSRQPSQHSSMHNRRNPPRTTRGGSPDRRLQTAPA